MLTLYYAEFSAPCQAVRLLARALNLDLQLKEVNLFAGEQQSAEYKKMNPAHTIPTLCDEGLYIWESRAIMAYLMSAYGGGDDKLYPKDAKQRAVVDNVLQFDLGSLFPSFHDHFSRILHGKPESEDAKNRVLEKLNILNKILSERSYTAGKHMTLADISILCSLHAPIIMSFDLSPYTHVCKWIDRIKKDLPFYDEVTTKGFQQYNHILNRMKSQQ